MKTFKYILGVIICLFVLTLFSNALATTFPETQLETEKATESSPPKETTTSPASPIPKGGSGDGITLPGGITITKPSNLPKVFSDVETAFTFLLNLAVGVAGGIFTIMLLVGGVQYLTTMGNEEANAKAKKTLLNAVIGIIVVAVTWVVGGWVLSVLEIGK